MTQIAIKTYSYSNRKSIQLQETKWIFPIFRYEISCRQRNFTKCPINVASTD